MPRRDPSLLQCYVLVFIHLGTRRVYIPGCTPNPNAAWTQQQARNFLMHVEDVDLACTHLIHDRDSSFLPFDGVLDSTGVDVVKTPPKTPVCNAYAERFVREVRETLDNLILIGEGQLHRAIKHIERHHNAERPHQGIGNAVPAGFAAPEVAASPSDVRSRPRLGGLLNHYFADAA